MTAAELKNSIEALRLIIAQRPLISQHMSALEQLLQDRKEALRRMTDPSRIQVCVAVSVDVTGRWAAYGQSNGSDYLVLTEVDHSEGDALTWVSAYVMKPVLPRAEELEGETHSA